MLLYNIMTYNPSLDTFERSKISSMLKHVLRKINTFNEYYNNDYCHNICLSSRRYKNRFDKDLMRVTLCAINNKREPNISHFNIFNCNLNRTKPGNDYPYYRRRKLRVEIDYKKLEIPLGKLRVNKFKGIRKRIGGIG